MSLDSSLLHRDIIHRLVASPHELQTQGNPITCSSDCSSLWNSIIWVREKYFLVFRRLNSCVSWARKPETNPAAMLARITWYVIFLICFCYVPGMARELMEQTISHNPTAECHSNNVIVWLRENSLNVYMSIQYRGVWNKKSNVVAITCALKKRHVSDCPCKKQRKSALLFCDGNRNIF